MAHRYAAGGTIASFPLIAAIPAFEAGNLLLAWGFIGLFLLGVVLVAAPKLPYLHNLGWGIGAPKLSAEFELNGSADLSLGLSPDRDGASALLLVRIRPPSNADVRSVWINVVLPRGIRVDRVNAYGEPESGGQWLQPIRHKLGKHDWAERWTDQASLTADLVRELWFKLEFTRPGAYPFLLKIGGSALYEEFNQSGSIEVHATDQLSTRDLIGLVIDDGDRLLRTEGDAFTGPGPDSAELLEWFIRGHEVVPDELQDLLEETPSCPGGSGAEALIRAQLRGLYDARRAL